MRIHFPVIFFAALVASGTASSQPTYPPSCDARLAKAGIGRDTTTYRVRGATTKWCEGVLVRQEVGNVELKLQAFTVTTPAVEAPSLRRIDTLVVQWTAPPGMVIHILARQATNPLADYYQLDVEVPTPASGAGTWSWPTEVVKGARMWPVAVTDQRVGDQPPAISVQAVGHITTNGKPDSVYIPVRVGPRRSPGGATQRPGRLQIVMTAKERVRVRRPSLYRMAADGSTTPVAMASGCAAITGGAVGGDPVTIPLCMPAAATSGIYVVALGASGDAAMILTTGVRFYYGAPAP